MYRILAYEKTCKEYQSNNEYNLVEIIVSDGCFMSYMKHLRIPNEDIDKWWSTYTEDDTIDFYDFVQEHQFEYKIEWYDWWDDVMEKANVDWNEEIIKNLFKIYGISPNRNNLLRVASEKFVESFRETLKKIRRRFNLFQN